MVLVLVIHLDILYLSFIPFHLQVQRNLVQMVSRVKNAPQDCSSFCVSIQFYRGGIYLIHFVLSRIPPTRFLVLVEIVQGFALSPLCYHTFYFNILGLGALKSSVIFELSLLNLVQWHQLEICPKKLSRLSRLPVCVSI